MRGDECASGLVREPESYVTLFLLEVALKAQNQRRLSTFSRWERFAVQFTSSVLRE